MTLDFFVAYKLQKRVENGLKEERERKRREQERSVTDNSKLVKTDCPKCGQNWLWCMCDHSILNEG